MASKAVAGPLGRLFEAGTLAGLGEGELLGRFVDRDDDDAFAALVDRHGPMVLAACRRRLRDPNDADDAFQATFLVLARRAPALRHHDRLGPWLHGVARRVAIRARARAEARWAACATIGPAVAAIAAPSPRPVADGPLAAIADELARLPDDLRRPVELCHLEGLTYDQAARDLGWTVGMVRGRLARARRRLRDRLAARGHDRALPVPPPLLADTIRIVTSRHRPEAVPPAVAALVEGATRAMILNAPRSIALGLLAIGLVSAGAFAWQDPAPGPAPAAAAAPRPITDDAPPDLDAVREALKNYWAGIRSLTFREESFRPGADGARDPSKAYSRLDFALAEGDKFAYDLRAFRPDGGETLILLKRWDGRDLYHFYPVGNGSAALRFVSVTPQREPRSTYDGEMSSTLWLLLPTSPYGKSPIPPIGAGSTLKAERALGAPGGYRVRIVSDRNPEAYAELDPDHGWLASLVTLSPGDETRVTRWARHGDRWFPAEIVQQVRDIEGNPITLTDRVTDVRVNQPIADSTFNRDDHPDLPVQSGP